MIEEERKIFVEKIKCKRKKFNLKCDMFYYKYLLLFFCKLRVILIRKNYNLCYIYIKFEVISVINCY